MNLSAEKEWWKDIEKGVVNTMGDGEGGMNWESSIDMYTLPSVK